jgi:flagellar biosynthesis protein FliQ
MSPEFAVQTVREALLTMLWLSAPLLIVGFAAGILISLLQIVTSIQDSAFNAVPRLAAFLVAFLVLMPWMLSRLMTYATSILGNLGQYAK